MKHKINPTKNRKKVICHLRFLQIPYPSPQKTHLLSFLKGLRLSPTDSSIVEVQESSGEVPALVKQKRKNPETAHIIGKEE